MNENTNNIIDAVENTQTEETAIVPTVTEEPKPGLKAKLRKNWKKIAIGGAILAGSVIGAALYAKCKGDSDETDAVPTEELTFDTWDEYEPVEEDPIPDEVEE